MRIERCYPKLDLTRVQKIAIVCRLAANDCRVKDDWDEPGAEIARLFLEEIGWTRDDFTTWSHAAKIMEAEFVLAELEGA
jgi:hypothetical protein